MRSIRLAAVTAIFLFAGAPTASAQCDSYVRQIASRNAQYVLEAKSAVWTGSQVGVISEQDPARGFFLSRFEPSGEPVGRESRVTAALGSSLVDFLWNGNEYGVFTIDSAGQLFLNRMTGSGSAAGTTIAIFRDFKFTDGFGIDVAWDPERGAYLVFAIAPSPGTGLWMTIVEPDGRLLSTSKVADAAADSFVRVARTDSGTIGVFFREEADDDVSLYRRMGQVTQLFRNVWTTRRDLDVTSFDNRFALTKWRTLNNGRQELVYALLDTNGQRSVQDVQLRIVYEREENQKLPLSIATGDGELGIAYFDPNGRGQEADSGTRLMRITPGGTILTDTFFAAANPDESRALTERDIVSADGSWIAALERETPLGSNSYLVRLCRLEAEIHAPRVALARVPVTLVGAVDGGVPEYDYRWSFSDGSLATGPTVHWTGQAPGDYSVQLVVTDASGVSVTSSFTVTLVTGQPSRRRAAGR